MKIEALIVLGDTFDSFLLQKAIKKDLKDQGLELKNFDLMPAKAYTYTRQYGSQLYTLSYEVIGDEVDYQLISGLKLIELILGTFELYGIPRTY